MIIPKFGPFKESRTYSKYPQKDKDKFVYHFLFEGLSDRELDIKVLNVNPEYTTGFQSFKLKVHFGFNDEHRGIFKGISELDVINELKRLNDSSYFWLINCLSGILLENVDNDSNVIISSWEILNNDIAFKTMDKSVFEHNGSGIPKDTRTFWNIENFIYGEKKFITLKYLGNDYVAYFHRESNEPYRTRLFWHSEFKEIIINIFPNYKKYEDNKKNYPIMRFEKLGIDIYDINFIVTEFIINDIELESESEIKNIIRGNKEGKQISIYSTKYERNSKNRKDAIKIHGTKCFCCGFDFEKIYGERGLGYIEIHHKKPLHNLDEEVVINPSEDLAPVCSNCHRIIHRKKDEVLSIEEVKNLIKGNRNIL